MEGACAAGWGGAGGGSATMDGNLPSGGCGSWIFGRLCACSLLRGRRGLLAKQAWLPGQYAWPAKTQRGASSAIHCHGSHCLPSPILSLQASPPPSCAGLAAPCAPARSMSDPRCYLCAQPPRQGTQQWPAWRRLSRRQPASRALPRRWSRRCVLGCAVLGWAVQAEVCLCTYGQRPASRTASSAGCPSVSKRSRRASTTRSILLLALFAVPFFALFAMPARPCQQPPCTVWPFQLRAVCAHLHSPYPAAVPGHGGAALAPPERPCRPAGEAPMAALASWSWALSGLVLGC